MSGKQIYFLVNMTTSFEERILRGMARFARAQNPRWRLRWGAKLDEDISKDCNGIVMFAVNPDALALVRDCGLPVVATSTRHLKDGFPCVVTDDQAIGELAATHFRERFYRSFAYLGPDNVAFGVARQQAFARALTPEPVRVLHLREGVALEVRLRDLRRDLERLPPQTAVFCANDVFARMVLTVLEHSARKVPGDLSVMGVDADELVGLSCPVDLTSIDSAPERIGERAIELLGRMIDRPGHVPADRVERVRPAGVVEGSSTDALATEDALVERAGQLIRQHAFDRDYSIDQLARDTGCSRRSLEVRFSEVTDMGISRHIWKLRMDRAKELLLTTPRTLTEIAEAAGFSSAYHLCEKFKKETGITPGRFRKKKSEAKMDLG
ncbi:MAG: substrate-binding domain-containing protein [Verrucomicrobia bacterium]|nr:substrate-binding domain-containing protein [Verrucomicrobiota bacterium]MCH8512560.1 substrate-binding domain-containing protein [Kiritimatiellia bacterium]